MASLCAEHRHSHLFSGKKCHQNIDIPPRRLLNRRSKLPISPDNNTSDLFLAKEEALLRKFLPHNAGDDEESDPYSSDDFRMYEFKIRRCMRSRSHDWTDCPFAHPGEKARRRDPRRFHYSGNVCTDFRRGGCRRGDACEFAHGVFECWLHPARYRTQACKDGKNCKRKVCFFAHTPRQLRVLPLQSQTSLGFSSVSSNQKLVSGSSSNHCCVFCNSVASSPTSTLMGISHLSPPLSPSLSPPPSPLNHGSRNGHSPFFSRSVGSSSWNQFSPRVSTYRDAIAELKNSMEAMDLAAASPTYVNKRNLSLDVSPNYGEDHQQLQFIFSPSTPQAFGSREIFEGDGLSNSFIDEKINNNGWSCPDLEWVNELVM
ncbi:hypothetical protein HHK36_001839 [Tetracentron sinense]|uniref:C3H1-type domain-containing protein n=1 Tax=Tetracentron sinense TaxID=13715 RepID=A0A834ZY75_TETSI|nr:hypothetical protein HHK36_001839 [Tetracentron sinense]